MGIYTFDDGLDRSVFERVVEGFLALLDPLLYEDGATPGARGPYLHTLRHLPVDPVQIFADKEASNLLGPSPAAWIVLGSGQATNTVDPKLIVWDQQVRIYVSSAVTGRLVAGRLLDQADAPGRDPGIYTLLTHCTELLHYAALPTVEYSGPIRVTEHVPVFSAPHVSVWRLTAAVEVQQCVNPDRGAELVEAIEATHDIDSKGVIATQLKEF